MYGSKVMKLGKGALAWAKQALPAVMNLKGREANA